MKACIQYAETDVVYDAAVAEVEAAIKDAETTAFRKIHDAQMAWDAYAKAVQEAGYNVFSSPPDTIAGSELKALREANSKAETAREDVEAARLAGIVAARADQLASYLNIYTEGGGMQSEVLDVMEKILNHQRNLCTEIYGL